MAYRAREKPIKERDGITHGYTAKLGVEHAEIILPAGVRAGSVGLVTAPSLPRR